VSSALDGLTDAQLEAVTHVGGPLLITGVAGSGRTRCLTARLEWLVEGGVAPESVLILAPSGVAAEEIRTSLEDRLVHGYEELAVLTPVSFCERLLRTEALEVGLDPFFVTATRADRVAMLLERVDELTLARHDFRGRPSALMAGFVERIDDLKAELLDAERYAARLSEGDSPEQDREFAQLYLDHDRMLAERGTPDSGELIVRTCTLLEAAAAVRARVADRYRHVLVDDFQDASLAVTRLIELLTAEHHQLVVAADEHQAIDRKEGEAPDLALERFRTLHPEAREVSLPVSFRHPDLGFWRCANERTQAQSVAGDIERLIGRQGIAPERIAVLVGAVGDESRPVAGALEERAIPYQVLGASAFFERAEVRDVLAWMRLLIDPQDSAAVVRALARPPIELRQVDLARVIQIARRRKLDTVSALSGALESPQIPPEARERIRRFLELHRGAAAVLDTLRPDLFVHRLIERLGLRRQQLFAAHTDVVERLLNLARLGELAADFARRAPQSTPRELAGYLAAVSEAGLPLEEPSPVADPRPRAVQVMSLRAARGREFDHVYVLGLDSVRVRSDMRRLLHLAMTRSRDHLVLAYPAAANDGAVQHPAPLVEEARQAVEGEWEEREEELFGPAETLHATVRMMREELLESVSRLGGRLGELRLDTDLDVSHGVVRYLELIKLAALLERPAGQEVAEVLADINSRLMAAATPMQREIYETSPLDATLLSAEHDDRARAQAIAARDEPSLEPFLARRGEGLLMSASDIETYRSCPLRYKFARVFRIPSEPTLNQRFGIAVHQVLDRYHSAGLETAGELIELLEGSWRRGGFGDSDQERQLHQKAHTALVRYHERLSLEPAAPVWFERSFSFRLGPHHLRGRVDRVDRLPDDSYELIDYKTGRPRTAAQLKDDIQLSLYAIGAREAWGLEASRQSYHYVLDDEKVPVPRGDTDAEWIKDTVLEVGERILGQEFEPTPSLAACSMCDYRIVCPAAEK
jgi:DNA helicase-2/ATP-dependent DNA helicase PcrA